MSHFWTHLMFKTQFIGYFVQFMVPLILIKFQNSDILKLQYFFNRRKLRSNILLDCPLCEILLGKYNFMEKFRHQFFNKKNQGGTHLFANAYLHNVKNHNF